MYAGGIQLGDRIVKIDHLDVVKMMEEDKMHNANSNGEITVENGMAGILRWIASGSVVASNTA